ncbi:MAG TPA: hypothetical protein VF135_04775, partial [Terriglobales bacterium]
SQGIPVAVPGCEIEGIRRMLQAGLTAEPFPFLKVGTKVEIVRGPLQGLTGILRNWHGSLRVVISVELIMQAIAVEVEAGDVMPISRNVRVLKRVTGS